MKCWECGNDIATKSYEEDIFSEGNLFSERQRLKDGMDESLFDEEPCPRYFCKECFRKRNEEITLIRNEYARLKKKLMFERAVRIFEKQAVDIYEYKDIIDEMEQYVIDNPEKFDSSYEIITAIVLVDNAIPVKIQHKIDRYRVDFFIEEYKTILEIDGNFHKANLYRDNNRDIRLREILGDDWETVRISTKYIETNAKALVDAMIAIKEEKQRIRKKHNGYLPDWYSERNKAKRNRSVKIGDEEFFTNL